MPANSSSVPWVFDVFAANNNTRAYFIAANPMPCSANHTAALHKWEGGCYLPLALTLAIHFEAFLPCACRICRLMA